MSELITPYHQGPSFYNDDGVGMVSIYDLNDVWVLDCFECDSQEFLKRINEFEQLQTKLAESEARVGRLLGVITTDVIDLVRCGIGGNYGGEPYHEALKKHRDPLIEALNETPTQSLQQIEAAAVERFILNAIKAGELVNDHSVIEKLRQQQTNGE